MKQFQNPTEKLYTRQNRYPNTQMYDRSLSWLYTGTSIQNAGVKLVIWAQNSLLNEMMYTNVVMQKHAKVYFIQKTLKTVFTTNSLKI